LILGAHVSTAGGVDRAPGIGAEFNIHAIAVFTKNQRQWKSKPLGQPEIDNWFKDIKEHNIKHTISHDSYLINLCAPDPEKLNKSLDSLTDEVERAETLNITNVVAHPGSHLKKGEDWGVEEIARSLSEIHKRLPGYKTKITLEITAGQGTNLGYTFEQIARMIELAEQNERLAVCFDTCHAFASGYDITIQEDYEKTFETFDRLIGLKMLEVFHINDSQKPLGSRVDRHEQIGDGLMGIEPFRFLMNDTRFDQIPAILETPKGDKGYAEDLQRLRSLIV